MASGTAIFVNIKAAPIAHMLARLKCQIANGTEFTPIAKKTPKTITINSKSAMNCYNGASCSPSPEWQTKGNYKDDH